MFFLILSIIYPSRESGMNVAIYKSVVISCKISNVPEVMPKIFSKDVSITLLPVE
jgi:hypothetical protein